MARLKPRPFKATFRSFQWGEGAMPANESISGGMRGNYQRRMLEVRGAFEAGGASGAVTIAARATAVDEVVKELWRQAVERDSRLGVGVALLAVGGYGRRGLF